MKYEFGQASVILHHRSPVEPYQLSSEPKPISWHLQYDNNNPKIFFEKYRICSELQFSGSCRPRGSTSADIRSMNAIASLFICFVVRFASKSAMFIAAYHVLL